MIGEMFSMVGGWLKAIVAGHYQSESEERQREADNPEYAERKRREYWAVTYTEYEAPGVFGTTTKRLYQRGGGKVCNKNGSLILDEYGREVVGAPGDIIPYIVRYGKLGRMP